MNVQFKLRNLFLFLLCLISIKGISQHTSRNNYTGAWETRNSWSPSWTSPQTNVNPYDITIYGYITAHSSLNFSGTSDMIIYDTLVIEGDLTLNDNSDLTINNNAIVVVRGSVNFKNHSDIHVNGTLIVTGNYNKSGPYSEGSTTSNDDPVHLFIGGTVNPAGLTNNISNYLALSCTSHPTAQYPGTTCSYGNMIDLANDLIYAFFLTTCGITTPVISANGPSNFCSGDSVTLSSGIGIGYLWSTGDSTVSIKVKSSGNYTVRITNMDGCLSDTSLPVLVRVYDIPVAPIITAMGPTTFCFGNNIRLVSTPGASYTWSTGDTTSFIIVDTAGYYSVKIKNSNGCASYSSVPELITVNGLPSTPMISAGGPISFCAGESVKLTCSKEAGYIWSNGPLNQVQDIHSAGNYSVRTINTSGCKSLPSAVSIVTVQDLPVKPTVSNIGKPSFCAGGHVSLYSSSGTKYLWSNGDTIQLIKIDSAGKYSVHLTNEFGCTSPESDSLSVIVYSLPLSPVILTTGPNTFCMGDSVILYSVLDSNCIWSNGEIKPSIIIKSSGSISLKVKSVDGCISASSVPALITVNEIPLTPNITSADNTTICEGDSVILTSSAGTEYFWSNGSTSPSISVSLPGSYTVCVSNSNGCRSSISGSALITVNSLPSKPIIISNGPINFCEGGSVGLSTSPGESYLWSNSDTSATIIITATGNYSVRITNANGCTSLSSLDAIIKVNPLPDVLITSNDLSMCVNDLRSLSGSPAGGAFSISAGDGSIAGNSLTAQGAGTIVLEYNYTGICSNKAIQSIIVNASPIADAGSDQELQFVFESSFQAQLNTAERGEWSVISGTAHITDIHSPNSMVTNLSLGENAFLWKLWEGTCEATSKTKIIVADIFVPTVITPDGNGINDLFKLADNIGRVELLIFNRWGNQEYANNNYLNDWNGRSSKGLELPNDTYFYLLNFENGQVRKGAILIKR